MDKSELNFIFGSSSPAPIVRGISACYRMDAVSFCHPE